MKKVIKIFIALVLCLFLGACSDKWSDHIGTLSTQENLYEVIRSNSDYSAFADLLDQSGYGKDLQASKNYTVIVPTNSAVEAIKSQYNFSDTAVLRSFVGYHIINSIYNVNESADTLRVENFRSKYVDFLSGKFDGVAPVQVNKIAANGIYHSVNTALTPLGNIMGFVRARFPELAQVKAITSLDTVDATVPNLVHLDQEWFVEGFQPMVREDQKSTYFVVDDAFYNAEYSKLAPYFKTNYEQTGPRPDSTTVFFTTKAILRDYIVGGEFNRANLPAEMVSLNGTTFSVNDADIISSHKVSNGIVHRVKKVNVTLSSQIKDIKLLGINPTGYRQSDKAANTYFRTKRDQNGELYEDLQIHGHNVSAFYAKFRKQGLNSVRYKVYGRAIAGLTGDPQTTEFIQYVHFFNPATVSLIEANLYNLPVIDANNVNAARMTFNVGVLNHEEVYLGEIDHKDFGALGLLVMSNGTGPIILEYLRFVPILP